MKVQFSTKRLFIAVVLIATGFALFATMLSPSYRPASLLIPVVTGMPAGALVGAGIAVLFKLNAAVGAVVGYCLGMAIVIFAMNILLSGL